MTRGETPNWTAPEVLSGERAVSPASDMYALANVLFEIAVRETPFGSVTGGDAQVKKQIIDGHRPEFPDPAHWAAVERAESALNDGTAPPYVAEVETVSRQEFVAIVGRAWAPDPQSRPSAAELVEQLQTLYDTFTREVTAEREKMRRSTFLPFKAQPARPPQPEGGGTTTGTSSLAGPNGTQAGPSFTGSVLPSLKESESAST
jgi:serine/threonine protein kinase